MTTSSSKLIFLVASLMFIFTTILLYQRKSAIFFFQDPFSTSPNGTLLKSTDLIFLKDPDVRIDLKMNANDIEKAFFKFLSSSHFACQNTERFGNILDGGWDICLAEPYRPKSPCLVYSFGINNDFSFDDAISNNLSCIVRSFDPSMAVQDHQRSAKIWFYKIGIGGRDTINRNGWTLKTLSTIVKSMNESDVIIDYLKMDVESSEWASLSQMLSDGVLSKVKQLGIELHMTGTDAKSLFNMYEIVKRLEDQGFRRWYYTPNFYHLKRTDNGFRSCCYEMVYINTKFLQQ